MKATELVKKTNVTIESIVKRGRRAEYALKTKNNVRFTLNIGSGHNILKTDENANTIDGLKIQNGIYSENNLRFGLTDEEIISILNCN